mmetsp:Transcript_33494/g.110753  ORF Transcript_33494/g.110753 Transcript_33494/m.110753 type:complete len:286 (+) Transcript_33494:641-1498(+)
MEDGHLPQQPLVQVEVDLATQGGRQQPGDALDVVVSRRGKVEGVVVVQPRAHRRGQQLEGGELGDGLLLAVVPQPRRVALVDELGDAGEDDGRAARARHLHDDGERELEVGGRARAVAVPHRRHGGEGPVERPHVQRAERGRCAALLARAEVALLLVAHARAQRPLGDESASAVFGVVGGEPGAVGVEGVVEAERERSREVPHASIKVADVDPHQQRHRDAREWGAHDGAQQRQLLQLVGEAAEAEDAQHAHHADRLQRRRRAHHLEARLRRPEPHRRQRARQSL